ncbi:hypothetical protein LOTGIDRAFT_228378 [Lottia gigantea]|uniref:Protein sleepless n=1 Tax=Lottia gigantea TaxID=225164 RepID=V4ASK0_LOTGI|nr:hypothetical protein LOTGIDRAFT_228378 [Lottia gigantea]ESO97825.1 hypothetical protein LOTGIDRAFT_228378 [Lottia gigantea]
MEKLVIYFFSFSLLITIGTCLQCQQCTTLESPTCLDPYGEDNLDDCEDKHTHCVKYKTVIQLRDTGYIDGESRESVVVTRTCERRTGYSDGCTGTSANGGVVVKCLCSTDNCNSASYLPLNYFMILCSLLFTVFRVFSN